MRKPRHTGCCSVLAAVKAASSTCEGQRIRVWRRERLNCEVQPPLRKVLHRRLNRDHEAHRWRRNRVPKPLIVRKQAGCAARTFNVLVGAHRGTVAALTNFRITVFADLRSIACGIRERGGYGGRGATFELTGSRKLRHVSYRRAPVHQENARTVATATLR